MFSVLTILKKLRQELIPFEKKRPQNIKTQGVFLLLILSIFSYTHAQSENVHLLKLGSETRKAQDRRSNQREPRWGCFWLTESQRTRTLETVSVVLLPAVPPVTSPLLPGFFFLSTCLREGHGRAPKTACLSLFPIFFRRQYLLGVQGMGADQGLERTDFRGGSIWNRA